MKLPEMSIFSNGHVVKYFNFLQGGLWSKSFGNTDTEESGD